MGQKNVQLYQPVDRIHGYDPNVVSLATTFVALGHSLLNKIKTLNISENDNKLNYVTINIDSLSVFNKASNVYTMSLVKDTTELSDATYDPDFNYLITYDPDIVFDVYHYLLDSMLEGIIKACYVADKDGIAGQTSFVIPLTTQILQGIADLKKELTSCSTSSLAVLDRHMSKIASFIPMLY